MDITIKCTSRKFGDIGLALIGAPVDGWTLGGKPLSATVAEYLVNYGVRQCLGDAYASAGNVDEAVGMFGKRYDRLVDGTIGVRESGGVKREDDPVMALAVKNAKAALMHRFEKVMPDAKRMSDYVKHDKIAPYFKLDKDDPKKAVWIEKAVSDWIARMKEGGKDFVAEAAETLAVNVAVDLDF